jgi:hypothetical protein
MDQRDGNRQTLMLQFHAQGVGKAVDGELGRGIGALHRGGAVAEEAAHVDDCPCNTPFPVMPNRRQGSVDDTRIGCLEHPPPVRHRHVPDLAEDGDAGVVHPGVEMTKFLHGGIGHRLHIFLLANVACASDSPATAVPDLVGKLVQRRLVARGKHDRSALSRRFSCGDEANAAAGAGNDDDLLGKRLQLQTHPHAPVALSGQRRQTNGVLTQNLSL